MEQQTAQKLQAELNAIKETLKKIQQDVDRLATLLDADGNASNPSWLALAGVGSEVWRSADTDVYIRKERQSWA